MNRILLLGHTHNFEKRLHGLLGPAVQIVPRRPQVFGSAAVLGTLVPADRPDIALLGAFLRRAKAYELSAGLARLYPGIEIVNAAESRFVTSGWDTGMTVHGVLSPETEKVGAFSTEIAFRTGSAISTHRDREVRAEVQAWDLATSIEAFPDVVEVLQSRVIAVVAPKGGLGKTTVATNLAVGLARLAAKSVVLIDADVQFGDVASALALEPEYTLPDVVQALDQNDTVALKTLLVLHESGFFTVCGASEPDAGDRVTGEQLSRLIRQLSELFRYVVIDTAPGLGEHALSAIELATDAVFLCDMSVPSARGLRKEIAVLTRIGLMPQFRHVVLNLADRKSGLSVRDIESITGVPVDVAVPRSNRVALSTNRGIPMLQDGGRNSGSLALSRLVARFEPNVPEKRGHLHRRVSIS